MSTSPKGLVNAQALLVGQPNSGKTSLFNALTGGRSHVANYPGVTVERKEGRTAQGLSLLDLPGTYSLSPKTPDEAVTCQVLRGREAAEYQNASVIAVLDATQLERGLSLVLELLREKRSVVLALNMMDLAQQRGSQIDIAKLSHALGIAVVPTVAIRGQGLSTLQEQVRELATQPMGKPQVDLSQWKTTPERYAVVDQILKLCMQQRARPSKWTARIDQLVLHPVWGAMIFLGVVSLLFQAIFTWAQAPQDAIEWAFQSVGRGVSAALGDGALSSLLVDGVIAGTGSVVVFLPQILILFTFILLLEDSGYMARAAFLMDYWMSKVGLHGRAFIPLLSSYACAIPGIMATRTIENPRDRLATILVAPLTTCSARLPVYSLLVGAFIPATPVFGPFTLQGLTMLGLYALGLVSALIVAFVLRRTVLRGPKPALLLEMPTYKLPMLRSLGIGLWERARSFIRRAGTVILGLSVLIWFLSSYPKPPSDFVASAEHPAIAYSFAGRIGRTIEPIFAPLGFNWRICVALIPGLAAREVMVGALATVYAVEGDRTVDAAAGEQLSEDDRNTGALTRILPQQWSVATALSLLVWYVFACQCLSTLAVTRRETGSWKWPAFMMGYMTLLAYSMAWVTYRVALHVLG